MPRNSYKLKIAYLYPDILKGLCDDINIETLYKRARWRDIDVNVTKIHLNDKLECSKYDLFYIGGSNVADIKYALEPLKKYLKEINVSILAGIPFIAVNCGYILFSDFYEGENKKLIKCLGIFNVQTKYSKNRHYGYISGTCDFLSHPDIAGFENHQTVSYLNYSIKPFLILKKGLGNNGQDGSEGVCFNNAIGTYITSPIFAQNPCLADYFLSLALKIKYQYTVPLTPINDEAEWNSHKYILQLK